MNTFTKAPVELLITRKIEQVNWACLLLQTMRIWMVHNSTWLTSYSDEDKATKWSISLWVASSKKLRIQLLPSIRRFQKPRLTFSCQGFDHRALWSHASNCTNTHKHKVQGPLCICTHINKSDREDCGVAGLWAKKLCSTIMVCVKVHL